MLVDVLLKIKYKITAKLDQEIIKMGKHEDI